MATVTDTYSDAYIAEYLGAVLYVFTPPTADRVPPVLADTKGIQYALYRHVHPLTQGMNLYLMGDGTYLLDRQPPHLSNPDPARTEWDTDVPVKTYYGGHKYLIDDVEAAALIAAGYGAQVASYGAAS